ncbi:LysM peptidoglycan-binding domain-containing protein [Halosquirtibacter xylanolyticus]|uniref:LysM peptidoglycan-binding domain-containing protein n=1 Tax=Halosquirtibacter xylanolyticus TaxID=3374599 RepID=UPI003747A408|nr:LysM peptidoglycan-binding domain-containing protein [Prolixibacteraceae bacterium]
MAQSNEDTKVVVGKKVYILHKVKKLETVYSIQKKYSIKASKLYEVNPKLSTEGLKSDTYIKIPIIKKNQKKEKNLLFNNIQDNDSIRFHKVEKKETLFSIARNYGISVKELERANSLQSNDIIKKGDLLRIPIEIKEKNDVINEEQSISNYQKHIVKDGETLFFLSRKYNIPFENIKNLNPNISSSLSINDTILIPTIIGTTIDNKTNKVIENKFFHYRISSKDSYWKLEQKYGVTKSDILHFNPILNDELIPNVVIRLPYRRTTNEVVRILDNDNFYQYHVEGKETLYTIANQHGVTVHILKELNPRLKIQGLMKGDEITIPKPEVARSFELGINDSLLQASYLIDKISFLSTKDFIINPNAEIFNIGIMLPIYSEVNLQLNKERFSSSKNDSVNVNSPRLYSRSKKFLSFYEGVMVGIDSLNRKGLNVKLYLFDTEKKTHSIDSLYAKGLFSNLDLIIGPIFPTTQQALMQHLGNKHVPVISPLSSDSQTTRNYENLYQVNPSASFKATKTAEYVIDTYADKNIITIKTNDKGLTNELITPIKTALFKEHINQDSITHYTEFKLGLYGLEGLRFILKKDQPNIILLPSRNEAIVSQTLGQLNALSLDFDITVIGFNEWTKYRSIKEEVLHNLNLHYLAPYHVDYNSTTTLSFIKRYRSYFNVEPNNYALQGYDISLYFGSAMLKFGSNYTQMIYNNKVNLNQMDPNFVKVSKFGGFMNNTLFIMNYSKNYEIKKIDTIGNSRSIPIQ